MPRWSVIGYSAAAAEPLLWSVLGTPAVAPTSDWLCTARCSVQTFSCFTLLFVHQQTCLWLSLPLRQSVCGHVVWRRMLCTRLFERDSQTPRSGRRLFGIHQLLSLNFFDVKEMSTLPWIGMRALPSSTKLQHKSNLFLSCSSYPHLFLQSSHFLCEAFYCLFCCSSTFIPLSTQAYTVFSKRVRL